MKTIKLKSTTFKIVKFHNNEKIKKLKLQFFIQNVFIFSPKNLHYIVVLRFNTENRLYCSSKSLRQDAPERKGEREN